MLHLAELWPAFVLGAVGSLHCAGMCGPLVLAMPAAGGTRSSFVAGRVAYQIGRLVTYALLGVVFGLLGTTLALAGVQRWVSIGIGVMILAGVLVWRGRLNVPAFRAVDWLKSGLSRLLQRRTLGSQFLFGGLNGLLPCGLVYAACAGAVAMGSFTAGVGFMLCFGLGTVPMMFALSLPGRLVQMRIAVKFQRLIPACLVLMALLLILRGLGLGIPYVSPSLSGSGAHSCCPPTAQHNE